MDETETEKLPEVTEEIPADLPSEPDPADFAKTLQMPRKVPKELLASITGPPGIPSLAHPEDSGKKKKSGLEPAPATS